MQRTTTFYPKLAAITLVLLVLSCNKRSYTILNDPSDVDFVLPIEKPIGKDYVRTEFPNDINAKFTYCLFDWLIFRGQGGGRWYLESGPENNNVAQQLLDDNPCIAFDQEPKGIYTFEYRICCLWGTKVFCFNVFPKFYNMDLGDIQIPDTIQTCTSEGTFVIMDRFDFYRLGVDASYSFDTVTAGYTNTGDVTTDTYNPVTDGNGYYNYTFTCSPVFPSGYVPDTARVVDVYYSFVIDNNATCPEICDSGSDEDGDGDIDCADSDCDPFVQISGNNQICVGDTTILTSTTAVSYSWSTGGTADTIEVIPSVGSNNYVITITDANGCTNTTSYAVQVDTIPIVNAGDTLQANCYDDTLTMSVTGAELYEWNPGDTLVGKFSDSPIIYYQGLVELIVKGTDGNGCVGYDTVTVFPNDPIILGITCE